MDPFAFYVNTSTCEGHSPALRSLGAASSLAACGAKAIAWPHDRCYSLCWLRAQTNACWCRTDREWMPVPTSEADSARIGWPCATSDDCSHNGVCASNGTCTCDVAWGGARCSELRLEPVDRAALGYRAKSAVGENISSWGAPIAYDAATQLWHGYASEMANGCGINAWETNSQIVHITAQSAFGPYTRREVVHSQFAHEPSVRRGPSGEWAMLFSSYALDERSTPTRQASECAACRNGTTPKPNTPGCPFQRGTPKNLGHRFQQMLSVSPDGPGGPWSAPVEIDALSAGWDWNTAFEIESDGSALALIRGGMTWYASKYADNTTWRAVGAPAGAPEGPQFDVGVEDPYVWRDRANASIVHALLHAFTPFYGVHAWAFAPIGRNWSAHGAPLAWHVSGPAYGNSVHFTDGTSFAATRRERPHLVWSPDGLAILALSNGVQFAGTANAPNGDGTFTLVQPVRRASTRSDQ